MAFPHQLCSLLMLSSLDISVLSLMRKGLSLGHRTKPCCCVCVEMPHPSLSWPQHAHGCDSPAHIHPYVQQAA